MNRPLLVVLFWVVATGAWSVVAPSDLVDQGRAAEAAENYQQAIDLYRRALGANPLDPAPARALADLFTNKGLHALALPVWQELVRRAPEDSSAWVGLAQTWSYLDQNLESAKTLELARQKFPDDADVLQALAWMLFKTESFHRGIALVEAWVAGHPPDRSLEMTLGTLYSSVLDYNLSRIHYLKSLTLAPGRGSSDRNFRAIAWYNLSLLETSFYQFDLADQAIRKSLDEENRPAGNLALGELYQSRRDFAHARRLYEKAVEADETPLGRFDLAGLFQQFGLLDEAEAQVTQLEHQKDDTWMYNYGVTKDKVNRDLAELRAALHRSRYYALDLAPRASLGDWVPWAWTKVQEGLLWWYYDQTWKSLLVKLSQSSLAASNAQDAWVNLTLADRERPALALKYLSLVRNQELPRNPRSYGSSLLEEGVIRRDPEVLKRALASLQVPWENDDRERGLATLVEGSRAQGRRDEACVQLTALYALNPGGLFVRGWALPVRYSVYGDEAPTRRWKEAFEGYAGQTGWDASTVDHPGVTWSLDLNAAPTGATWNLRDADGQVVRSGELRAAPGGELKALAELVRVIHSPR